MKKLLLFVLLTGLFLMPAVADRTVGETVDADPDGEVSIELIAGEITIVGWDRDSVEVTGTVGDDVEEVEVESSGGRVSIEVELVDHDGDDHSYNDADVQLEIRVPRSSQIDFEAVSAELSISGVDGDGDIETVSGTIEVDGGMRELQVASVSGDILIRSKAALTGGEFQTVSGDIELDAELGRGDFSFESVSGNITLRLAGRTSAEFDIETFSGRIDNAFGPQAERTDEYTPGKELHFELGGGDARVEIESFSGTVELKRN
jgi:DUF4097 and DUF4098 domain-containing protein YvlB